MLDSLRDAPFAGCGGVKANMKFLCMLLVMVANLSYGNTIIGTWEHDVDRTMQDLRNRETAPKRLIECFEKNICGVNTAIRFTEDTVLWAYFTHILDESLQHEEKYAVIEFSEKELVLQMESGEKLQVHFIDSNSIYWTLENESGLWREYFKRQP